MNEKIAEDALTLARSMGHCGDELVVIYNEKTNLHEVWTLGNKFICEVLGDKL